MHRPMRPISPMTNLVRDNQNWCERLKAEEVPPHLFLSRQPLKLEGGKKPINNTRIRIFDLASGHGWRRQSRTQEYLKCRTHKIIN